jgi:group I intron endonuclease
MIAEHKNKGIVYLYTSPSGKQYVGQTWDEEQRRNHHSKARGKCPAFHQAVRKYGYGNFKYEVLYRDIEAQEEMDRLEMQEIASHNTISPNGYNLSTGGSSGRMCEEARKKISDSRIGMQFTEEHRANLRKAKEYVSPETRQKMREQKLGKKQSPELIKKRSDARRGHKHSLISNKKTAWHRHLIQQRYVRCIELNVIFDCSQTAAKVLDGSGSGITNAAAGRTETSGGYHWEYMN